MGRSAYDPVDAVISFTDPIGHSYNPTLSTSHLPIDASAIINTISGQSVTGHFAGETCTLQSFTYNASGSYMCGSSPTIELNAFHPVLLTDSAVTNDVYPDGARAILGYGVKGAADAPQNASLIPTFLGCVNCQLASSQNHD